MRTLRDRAESRLYSGPDFRLPRSIGSLRLWAVARISPYRTFTDRIIISPARRSPVLEAILEIQHGITSPLRDRTCFDLPCASPADSTANGTGVRRQRCAA